MSIESSNDPERFSEFEHSGWEEVSRGYEQHIARLTAQSVNAVLDAAAVGKNSRVLDVCCGPGVLSAAAISRDAQAVGIDFSADAIDIARSNVMNAEFHEGDALSLPFESDSFDAVVCGFGIIHVPDPETALSEMHRVLKPGGQVAMSVWEAPNPNNGFGLLYTSISAHADMNVDLPHGPDFFQFSDEDILSEALINIGFRDPLASTVSQTWEFSEPSGLVRSFIEGSVRARGLIMAQTADVQEAISTAIAIGMETFRSSDGLYRLPMPAIVGSATK